MYKTLILLILISSNLAFSSEKNYSCLELSESDSKLEYILNGDYKLLKTMIVSCKRSIRLLERIIRDEKENKETYEIDYVFRKALLESTLLRLKTENTLRIYE